MINPSALTLFSAFIGFETKNKYAITDVMGKPVFCVTEDSDCCTRQCFGSARPLHLCVLDLNGGREVLRMSRPLRCDSCCFPCCLQVVVVGFLCYCCRGTSLEITGATGLLFLAYRRLATSLKNIRIFPKNPRV